MTNDTNKKNQTLGILDGERGLPNVHQSGGNNIKRGLVWLFLFGSMLVTLCFTYLSYVKSHKPENKDTSKHIHLTTSVPERTFELPVHEQMVLKKNEANKALDDKLFSGIDKSSAALMVSKEKSTKQFEEATATPNRKTESSTLGDLLNPTSTPAQSASVLKNRDYLLAKGSFIDCVLQTKLDSTVPGMTGCVVTRNIYGDTGKVLLIERGSTVSGEYQSNMKQGQARIFVLWNRIKTPNGVVINLDSPGTDSLGAGGVPGYVDTHFWERFGGAIMMSLIQDAGSTTSNILAKNTDTTITLNNTAGASQALAVETLKNTVNIPPTLYKNQGERVGIYVARDLDFKTAYDLKPE
jgi:type IV secretion system protein VirB10